MLTFFPITKENFQEIADAYKTCDYRLCEYSLGEKLMWDSSYHHRFAFASGCLIEKEEIDGKESFEYPVKLSDDADAENALTAIEEYCADRCIPLIYADIPEEKLGGLVTRYRKLRIVSERDWDDYLYSADDLAHFAGKHYAGQRNHIRRFYEAYPDAVFKPLTEKDFPKLREFLDGFSYHAKKDPDAMEEMQLTEQMLFHHLDIGFAGYMEADGKICSVSFGERCGDTVINHIEKADFSYEGIYPATVQAFADLFCKDVPYINREDDAGDPGLRKSKLQYRPKTRLKKYGVTVENELSGLYDIPTLSTERLLLSALTLDDCRDYNRLCLDDERNRCWGYDYREDCAHPDECYFVNTAKSDFENRTVINWGIREKASLIGEILLYRFDGKGSAEIGIRLLPEAEGNGYGREAMEEVLAFATRELSLDCVFAKCFRENEKSRKLLSSVMQKESEDATCFYFAYRNR